MKPWLDPNLRIVNSKYYAKYYVYSLKYSVRESFCWKHNLRIPVIFAAGTVVYGDSQHWIFANRLHNL